MTRLKRVATLAAGGTPAVDNPQFWDEANGLPWVSIGDMSDGRPVCVTPRHVSAAGMVSKRLPIGMAGTLLFAMYASVGAVGELAVKATWNQALLGIQPRKGLADRRFVRYWLQHLRPTLSALSRSNTQDNLNAEQVGNFPFPTFGVHNQRAIADYLDTETARIDALITKKRRLIELLEERRISFLSEQFDAMGATETRRLLAYCEVVLGRQRSPQHERGPYMKKYLRAANVQAGRLNLDDVMEMNFTPVETGRFMLRPEDVLVTEGSGSRGAVGASAVWLDEIPGPVCFQNTLLRLRARIGVDPAFLGWWAEFAHATGLFAEIAGGANIFHLSADRVKDISMRKVDLFEQQLAVERLAAFKRSWTELVLTIRGQVILLIEHRQALITAAVTGELDIPATA